MDFGFDSAAAERLLKQMEKYSVGIQKESRALKRMMDDKCEWDDYQKKAFNSNINAIMQELDMIQAKEDEYRSIFANKIKELQG